MIKKILIGFCLFFSAVTWAQEGTASPYSFYGIGDVKFKGAVENRTMGGVSVFSDSIHVNLQNPASFSHLKFTTFTVGANYNNVNLKTESQSENATRTTIDYLVVAVPVSKKFGAALGLLPFSSVGYKIEDVNEDRAQPSSKYFGEGGVNRFFGGLAYKFNDNLSIGADVSYNFGNISTNSIEFIPDIQYGTRELNASRVNGVSYNFGAMYNRKITEKMTLFGSLAYSPESTLSIDNERNITTVLVTNDFSVIPQEEGITQESTSKLKLPSKFVFGAGIGEVRKWVIGAELTMQQSSNFGNRFNDIDNVEIIKIDNPTAGDYVITISHKNNLVTGVQNYSLIVTGISSNFAIVSTSESVELCSNQSATYTFNYKQTGAGTTSFTATGVPAGANVSISPTSLSANGNVTMTVSNLSSVIPGEYNISIVGNNGTETETRTKRLKIYSSSFEPTILSSPINAFNGTSTTVNLDW